MCLMYFFVVEHINIRKDCCVLEGGKVSSGDLRGGCCVGSRGDIMEVCDVHPGSAIAHGAYRG